MAFLFQQKRRAGGKRKDKGRQSEQQGGNLEQNTVSGSPLGRWGLSYDCRVSPALERRNQG